MMASNNGTKSQNLELQDRDIWAFEGIGKMAFLQVADVAKLYFDGSDDAASKRLRRLAKAGFLKQWEKAVGQKSVFSITRAGLHAVAERHGDDLSHVKVPNKLPATLAHHLRINQCRIALALELPKAGGALSWWRSDWELRDNNHEPIVPDAAFRIEWQSGMEQSCLLEVERETRDAQKFRQKILAYVPYRQLNRALYGLSDFMLLVVCERDAQLTSYRQAVADITPTEWMWMTTVEAVTQSSGIDPVWQAVCGEGRFSLQNLAEALPVDRKGSGS